MFDAMMHVAGFLLRQKVECFATLLGNRRDA